MTNKIVIKYFDFVIKNIDSPLGFPLNNTIFDLFNPNTPQERNDFLKLCSDIKDFGEINKYWEQFGKDSGNGGYFKLTDKGLELKKFGKGHLKFEKSKSKTKWYNENWIGYVIAFIVFVFSVYQYFDNRSLKNEFENLKNQYEIYKDSTYQLNKELVVASGNSIYLLILNGFKGLYSRIGSLYFSHPQGREISRDFYQKLIALASENKFDESIFAVRKYGIESGKLWLELKEDVLKELAE